MESPVASLDLCADAQGTKSKSKVVLNRRPSGYWKVFSAWWRGRFQALKTRPTVHEVIEWYNKNAATSWPAGQVPSLKAVLRQSKGLRPIDGLKEYFREYRKKRKQQGGQALTANDDAPSSRRARPAKRRRARSSRDDSSDEDEMEAELSVCSDEDAEAQVCSEDGEACEAAADCQDGAAVASSDEPSCAAAPAVEAASEPVAAESALPAAPMLLPGGWLAGPSAAAEVAAAGPSAELALQSLMFPTSEQVGFPQPAFAPQLQQLESPFMPMSAMPPLSMPKNAVHPAVAVGMVPLTGADCSNSSSPSLVDGPSPDLFDSLPNAPFVVLPAVPVRRGPPRLTARTRRAAAATLPPLTASSSSPVADQQQQAQSEEEHAADRCSAGGCMPPPNGRAFHHQGFDGFYPPYGPPMPYSAYPQPVCTCYPPRPVYPTFRAHSADCSSGGAASSGCCGPMPPQCFPPPHNQHQPAWGWYGPEPSCPYPCCAAPPPPCTIAGCRCGSPMPSPPHVQYAAWQGPHNAPASSEPWEAAASPAAQHGGIEHASDLEVCSSRGPEHGDLHKHQQHNAAVMVMMHHGRHAPSAYPHHHHPHPHAVSCPPWSRHSLPTSAPVPCGMVTVGSTNSVASLEVESGFVGAPSAEPCRLQRTSWPLAHDQQQPHAPASMASGAPEAAVALGKCAAATALDDEMALPRLDSLGAAGREGLDHELGMAWESFLNDGTDAMVDNVLVDV